MSKRERERERCRPKSHPCPSEFLVSQAPLNLLERGSRREVLLRVSASCKSAPAIRSRRHALGTWSREKERDRAEFRRPGRGDRSRSRARARDHQKLNPLKCDLRRYSYQSRSNKQRREGKTSREKMSRKNEKNQTRRLLLNPIRAIDRAPSI